MQMLNTTSFLVILFVCACTLSAAAKPVPEPQPVKADMLVGAYYFPGWSREDRWYCIKACDTAQHPLMGYYREGNPDVADWQIKWALEHGISFFMFDFYTDSGSQMYESALDDGFLKARYIDRFKFALNWCNHAGSTTATAEEMEQFGDLVIKKYLTHPSYLKIDGKPVVQILVGCAFINNLGLDGAKKAFRRFEDRCKEAGLKGVYWVFADGGMRGEESMKEALELGVNAFCLYNYPYLNSGLSGPGTYKEIPLADLLPQIDNVRRLWKNILGDAFWPTVMAGWDRRPWTKDYDLIRTGCTPELIGKFLENARKFVNKDRVVMIEAWNEWGEGSVIEPSVEYGFAYLDTVRKVFCSDAPEHKDVFPKPADNPGMLYPMNMPSADTWKFDFDAQGWTEKNISDVKARSGVYKGVSTTDDCNITSPITYLDCKNYSKLYIRMRAYAPQDGPSTATGQFFWATVETGISEQASVSFPVYLDGKWHEYEADLRAKPKWKGRTDRLRFDPVNVKGVEFEIDEIKLL